MNSFKLKHLILIVLIITNYYLFSLVLPQLVGTNKNVFYEKDIEKMYVKNLQYLYHQHPEYFDFTNGNLTFYVDDLVEGIKMDLDNNIIKLKPILNDNFEQCSGYIVIKEGSLQDNLIIDTRNVC